MPLNKKEGFLLLEVLVSITIISVALVFVARSFSSSQRAVKTAAHFLKSISFMEQRIWDLEAEGAVERGSDEGTFEDNEKYSWRLEIEDLKDAPLNTVDLNVEWKSMGKRQRVSLTTYLWNKQKE